MAPISDLPPFPLHENLYFLGSKKDSVHVIRTEVGLVMIDTGWPYMLNQILDSMQCMGLDPRELVAIRHSHGHVDHFGCTLPLRRLSGAKTYISRIDGDILNRKNAELSWCNEMGWEKHEAFDADVLLDDGDVLEFGKTKIRCVLTPGHTDGVLSFFITLPDGTVCAMHGGVGLNTLKKKYLDRYGLSYERRQVFRDSLHKVMGERVDLVLGNHPAQSDTEKKREKLLSGESILDPEEWGRFLKKCERKLDELLEEEK